MTDLHHSPTLQNPNPDLVLEMRDTIEPSQFQKGPSLELSKSEEVEEGAEAPTPTSRARFYRRGGGGGIGNKKAKKKRAVPAKKAQQKMESLAATFKPIPFSPAKVLDVSSHEKLLRRLGLWEFVHLEFDSNLRNDLLVQLIATYNPQNRGGYVNGVKIGVNRADLARALKLPPKKDKDKEKDRETSVVEVEESKESVSFIEELVSYWFLLHQDTWIMPEEIMCWGKMIKAGQLEKVEWATMMWYMVEKELTASPLTDCYYASHLQCLIKYQKQLLLQGTKMEVDVKEDIKEGAREEEEGEHGEDVNLADKEVKVLDHQVTEPHVGPNIELTLGGQENAVELNDDEKEVTGDDEKEVTGDGDLMDFMLSKDKEQQQWLMDGKSNFSSESRPFLRSCNHAEAGDVIMNNQNKDGEEGFNDEEQCREEEVEEEEEEEEEEEDNDGPFSFSFKGEASNGVTSENFLDPMETAQLRFDTGLQICSSGEFLEPGVETQMAPGSSSIFGNANKSVAGNGNDISHRSLNGNNKRLRTDEHWDEKDVVGLMEQAMNLMGKARMAYNAKEQDFGELSMNQHLLVEEVRQRENVIQHLQETKLEEQHKKQMEVFRLEREVYMMAKLLDGYRKALKETNRAFSEYRARYPQIDEPLYKDVKGSGGLVLSSAELEKKRLKQEEEDRMKRSLAERIVMDFEAECIAKFESHLSAVCSLADRLSDSENNLKNLKELFRNSRISNVRSMTELLDISNEAKVLLEVPDEEMLDVPKMPDVPKISDVPNENELPDIRDEEKVLLDIPDVKGVLDLSKVSDVPNEPGALHVADTDPDQS